MKKVFLSLAVVAVLTVVSCKKTEAAAEDVKNASKEATAHVAGAVEQGAADVKEKAQ